MRTGVSVVVVCVPDGSTRPSVSFLKELALQVQVANFIEGALISDLQRTEGALRKADD